MEAPERGELGIGEDRQNCRAAIWDFRISAGRRPRSVRSREIRRRSLGLRGARGAGRTGVGQLGRGAGRRGEPGGQGLHPRAPSPERMCRMAAWRGWSPLPAGPAAMAGGDPALEQRHAFGDGRHELGTCTRESDASCLIILASYSFASSPGTPSLPLPVPPTLPGTGGWPKLV